MKREGRMGGEGRRRRAGNSDMQQLQPAVCTPSHAFWSCADGAGHPLEHPASSAAHPLVVGLPQAVANGVHHLRGTQGRSTAQRQQACTPTERPCNFGAPPCQPRPPALQPQPSAAALPPPLTRSPTKAPTMMVAMYTLFRRMKTCGHEWMCIGSSCRSWRQAQQAAWDRHPAAAPPPASVGGQGGPCCGAPSGPSQQHGSASRPWMCRSGPLAGCAGQQHNPRLGCSPPRRPARCIACR